MKTDTPRTDEAALDYVEYDVTGVSVYFAQKLEIENARLREALERIANMPEYDQDDAHRLRHAAKVILSNAEVWDGDAQAGTREKTSSPFPAPSCSPLPESPKD